MRGSLKLELEPGKYNKDFRGWASDTFSSFKIRSASIGPNLKNKRGVGNFFFLWFLEIFEVSDQMVTSEIHE